VGEFQSPIDIAKSISSGDLRPLRFDYRDRELFLSVAKGSLVGKIEDGGTLWLGEQGFAPFRLSLHAPSEHRIRGVAADLEIQLLHRNERGDLVALSILANEGRRNVTLDQLIQTLRYRKHEGLRVKSFSLEGLLPERRGYYIYTGSETTPPCREGVLWVVLSEPISVGRDQVDAVLNLVTPNNRPIQAGMGRTPLRSF